MIINSNNQLIKWPIKLIKLSINNHNHFTYLSLYPLCILTNSDYKFNPIKKKGLNLWNLPLVAGSSTVYRGLYLPLFYCINQHVQSTSSSFPRRPWTLGTPAFLCCPPGSLSRKTKRGATGVFWDWQASVATRWQKQWPRLRTTGLSWAALS